MKMKRLCSVVLAMLLILSLCTNAFAVSVGFSDVTGHWCEETILSLAETGVICGYPDDTIRPDNKIARGEFSALVARAFDCKGDASDIGFEDMDGNWARGYTCTLIAEGVIIPNEYGRHYGPDIAITRMEMIRMLVRALGHSDELTKHSGKTDFTDDGLLSDSDRSFINLAKSLDFLSGYPNGEVKAYATATRAEAFALLMRVLEIKEQIKKDEKKPDLDSGFGHVPVHHAEIIFELPDYVYVNARFTLATITKHTSSVKWTLWQDGAEVDLSSTLEGTLGKDGGSVSFQKAGNYTLKAAATGSSGKEAVCERSIRVYDVADMTFTLPMTAHTDTAIPIEVLAENLGVRDILWTVQCDGKAAEYDGALTNSGGVIRFPLAGRYTVTANAEDEAGNPICHIQSVEIFPVVELILNLPETAHTDELVTVRLDTTELGTHDVTWALTNNGKAVNAADWIDGSFLDGTIRFREKGVYGLAASVTDATGRVFSNTASITVYPVGSAGFYLPDIFHTDRTVTVEAVFSEIGSHTAIWSLTRNGETVSLTDTAEGTLNNSGGALRFYEKGAYVLKAEFTDDGGRTYSYEQSFTVYPVPTVSYSLPATAHTDTNIPVAVTVKNTEGLSIEWLVDNIYGFQHWDTYIDGLLTNSGGTIRFKHAGTYELTARITDATGRVFLYEVNHRCEVHPVLRLNFSLPAMAHTGDVLVIRTAGNNNVLPVEWTLTRDGASVPLAANISGTLNAYGGDISFTQKGSFTLCASIIDVLGRVFSATESIEVIPVAEISITTPGAVHYGTPFEVSAITANLEGRDLIWTLAQNGVATPYSGTLDNAGGRVSIHSLGRFELTASITDTMGTVYSCTTAVDITNTAPSTPVITVEPTRAVKDGAFLVNISASASDADGDPIVLEWEGAAADSYYSVGAHPIRVRARDSIGACSDWAETTIVVTNAAPTVTLTATPTRSVKDGKFLANISAAAMDADDDPTELEWEGTTADSYYPVGIHTIKVRAVDSAGACSDWAEATFTITNAAPTVTLTVTPTRISQDGKFFVDIGAEAWDADDDPTELEWEGTSADSYYSLGTHTIRVRAKDATGMYSDWQEETFTLVNSAPTAPAISRTPSGNSVAPGTAVTINADSTDPDGDAFTLIWRVNGVDVPQFNNTQTYPLGKNTVQVKAVDSHGAESPWAAIVFFVADANGSGGMTLVSADSYILESGVEGATITAWTFTVPAVSGHSASYDYGEVKGYNQLTQQWERLTQVSFDASIGSSFAATDGNLGRVYSKNGVHMYGTLQAGIYTQLQCYYYTPHDCMYNKSNITYSVEYHFE